MRALWLGVLACALGVPRLSLAFCGFYVSGADGKLFNDATQVVLMREGTRTVLSMQNHYKGPPEGFALVVPVPVVLQKDDVKTLSKSVLEHLDKLDAPRLVEYWEQDPCAPIVHYGRPSGHGGGFKKAKAKGGAAPDEHGVTIEAEFTVGEYEIVILSAQDSQGLDAWLREGKYKIPAGAEPYLRPYVAQGSKFFVAKVDPQKVQFVQGQAQLSPLRFHYDSDRFALPIRLGLANSSGTQDLIVHILARGQRYEVANYGNVFIPTNLDVAETARERFGELYAALFDRTLSRHPRSVVTEYAWDAGTCDPCPGPAMLPGELALLGGDVLSGAGMPKPGPSAKGRMSGPRRWMSGFVLTRLHARYTKDNLGEDLVFRAAAPISGGREVRNEQGVLEHGARPDGLNNFQGRYAIRHAWGGPVACQSPRRGIWGGPPGGLQATPRPALDLAFARRGVKLRQLLVRGQEAEGEKGTAPRPSPVRTRERRTHLPRRIRRPRRRSRHA